VHSGPTSIAPTDRAVTGARLQRERGTVEVLREHRAATS